MIEKYNSTDFKMSFHKDDLIKDVNAYTDIENLKILGSDVQDKKEERASYFLALPTQESVPFVNVSTVETNKGFIVNFQMGWVKENNDGTMPTKVHSSNAYRKDNKPSMIKGNIEEDGTIFFQEVLFSEEHYFKRYLFDRKGNVSESWVFVKDKKSTKIYELKRPMYISYYTNGEPHEVWFSNPKAKKFVDTNATVRMSDDLPVVVSFYEMGALKSIDYTGFVFSDKDVQDIIQNFPFNSRKKFYLPSYTLYSAPDKNNVQYISVEKYFLNKREYKEEEVLAIIGKWGVDTSNTEIIEKTLDENPIFEDTIRDLHGISIMTDEDLDETLMLHSNH